MNNPENTRISLAFGSIHKLCWWSFIKCASGNTVEQCAEKVRVLPEQLIKFSIFFWKYLHATNTWQFTFKSRSFFWNNYHNVLKSWFTTYFCFEMRKALALVFYETSRLVQLYQWCWQLEKLRSSFGSLGRDTIGRWRLIIQVMHYKKTQLSKFLWGKAFSCRVALTS